MRCGDPYFGQQQAFVLLPECEAGGRRIRECLCGGQPEYLYRAGLSGAESGQVGCRWPAPSQHYDAAAEPCQTGRAELCTGPAGLYGQERPLLRCAGLRGKPAGHQARTGSDRRRAEGSQKIPRQPAHLRGQVHHRPSGGTRRHRGQPCVHLLLPAEARLHGRSEGGAEEIRKFQGMPRDRHRHHHRRLFRPGYHWHRVCTEGK